MNGIESVMNNAQITAIAALAGIRHGYDDVKAEFAPFRDFKLKWTRSYKWISFEVSDYLQGAPEDVLSELFVSVFNRIAGDDSTTLYSEKVRAWLTDPEFADRTRPTFLRRLIGYEADEGWIAESVGRLRDMGLEVPDDIAYGTVEQGMNSSAVGRSSALMKVVSMNPAVSDLDENARDFAVWTQVAHVSMGLDKDPTEYEARLSAYPGRDSAERELRTACLHI